MQPESSPPECGHRVSAPEKVVQGAPSLDTQGWGQMLEPVTQQERPLLEALLAPGPPHGSHPNLQPGPL